MIPIDEISIRIFMFLGNLKRLKLLAFLVTLTLLVFPSMFCFRTYELFY